ncbi:hypothetical protein A3197_03375 [Candidatus Thiodiazotropha endoloripes]|nr:hypothetical protein A3197_03375 [Candidatus Thiodiazotropha endoloripes]
MKRVERVTRVTFINVLSYIGWPAAFVYFISMVVVPWVEGNGDWQYVQNVWDRWQALNVGMLALVSSLVALNVSFLTSERVRGQNFRAAKAFLPEALSELSTYFKTCATVLNEAWDLEGTGKLQIKSRRLPDGYKEIFAQCIKYSEPDIENYLSKILVKLQIHDARMGDFIPNYNDDRYIGPHAYNLITYYYRLAELQIMIDNLFGFARGREEFTPLELSWDRFDDAYAQLDVFLEEKTIENDSLTEFTKRALERGQD